MWTYLSVDLNVSGGLRPDESVDMLHPVVVVVGDLEGEAVGSMVDQFVMGNPAFGIERSGGRLETDAHRC